ncbi:MAG TPA: hypothetical protein VFH83_15410 [Spirochaetia bacterium]|nr:hypothetical protein [Spirochaetia bacterium]
MMRSRDGILTILGGFFSRRFSKFREINRKYATPHVTMTRGVKVALFLLRIYLLLLVGLLIVKFVTLVVAR